VSLILRDVETCRQSQPASPQGFISRLSKVSAPNQPIKINDMNHYFRLSPPEKFSLSKFAIAKKNQQTELNNFLVTTIEKLDL
jgi:hypothetical protein